jgi:hypothetical protein
LHLPEQQSTANKLPSRLKTPLGFILTIVLGIIGAALATVFAHTIGFVGINQLADPISVVISTASKADVRSATSDVRHSLMTPVRPIPYVRHVKE